ncbi:hypothetical protein ACVVIH_03955 [Chryseobacterium arthrosphaerae]|uniref:hypothetical protein n=1 Tax=Chryseobacterium arthrosphaerae TaxID=651561 RepID=UPI001BAF4633|nr:hypothetical protein [Chryseobacterium arthrosphaerae]QUY57587.1 hypothetical protein I2F65_09730 [Chryseobacterium arthrosphaerae]
MIKKTFTISILSQAAKAQVGVNITLPLSTLDVTARNKTGTASSIDGILFPRVDRQRHRVWWEFLFLL